MYPRTIRNFNAFLDGRSYFGRVLEAKLPEVKLQTAAHRGGGMDAPMAQDMGMEAMKSEIILAEWPPELLKMFGTRQRLVCRPTAMGQHDFTADAYVATIGGLMSAANMADLKPGNDTPATLQFEVDYYRLEKDGDLIWEIDIEAGKRQIGDVDQLAALRAAMGV